MDKAEAVFKKLDAIRNLPTLPVVIRELRKQINNPNSDARRIARIIEDDPAIMARVLRVVNSAFYRADTQITSVQMAVARLGMKALSNVALSTSVFSSFGSASDGQFKRKEFWRHSICVGIAAAVLLEEASGRLKRRYSADVMHLMGLMHDIGKIVFDQYFREDFEKAVAISAAESVTLLEAERRVIGLSHEEAGAWLGAKWNLDADLIQVIRWHHAPEDGEEPYREEAALVHMANYICNVEKIGDSGDSAPEFLSGEWKRLGFAVTDISRIVDRVNAEAEKSEVLMSFV